MDPLFLAQTPLPPPKKKKNIYFIKTFVIVMVAKTRKENRGIENHVVSDHS